MKNTRPLERLVRSMALVVAGLGILGATSLAGAQTMVHVIGSRFPAVEYYVKAMGQAPGVKVEGTLLAGDKFLVPQRARRAVVRCEVEAHLQQSGGGKGPGGHEGDDEVRPARGDHLYQ
jgi:hypothetical protein